MRRRRKLTELSGRRHTPWTSIIGALLIVALGIFLTITEHNKVEPGENISAEKIRRY